MEMFPSCARLLKKLGTEVHPIGLGLQDESESVFEVKNSVFVIGQFFLEAAGSMQIDIKHSMFATITSPLNELSGLPPWARVNK